MLGRSGSAGGVRAATAFPPGRAVRAMLLPVGLAVAFTSPGRCQQWVEQPDQVGTQMVQVGRAHVTLPPGEWTQEVVENWPWGGSATGAEHRIYFQIDHSKIVAVAAIASDLVPVYVPGKWGDTFWVPGRDCTRQDVPFTSYVSTAPPSLDCLYISHDTMTRSSSHGWSDAKSVARQYGGFIRPMIYTSIRLEASNRSDWVYALVFVDPGRWGFAAEPNVAWVDSSWQRDNIDQKHQAFVDMFSRWALAYRVRLRQSWE